MKIKLNEAALTNIVMESVRKVIREWKDTSGWMDISREDDEQYEIEKDNDEKWKPFSWVVYYPSQVMGEPYKTYYIQGEMWEDYDTNKPDYRRGPNSVSQEMVARNVRITCSFYSKDTGAIEKECHKFTIAKLHGGRRLEVVGRDSKDGKVKFMRFQWDHE